MKFIKLTHLSLLSNAQLNIFSKTITSEMTLLFNVRLLTLLLPSYTLVCLLDANYHLNESVLGLSLPTVKFLRTCVTSGRVKNEK